MTGRAFVLCVSVATVVAGCAAPEATPGPLVEPEGWGPSDVAHDPLAGHRPPQVSCPAIAWKVEGSSLEVSTSACNYLSLEQPLSRYVPEGTPIRIDFRHQALSADGEAVGHAAIAVGADILWEREVPIPFPPTIWQDVVLSPRDLEPDERVIFHLHNHGANTWNLGEVAVDPEPRSASLRAVPDRPGKGPN